MEVALGDEFLDGVDGDGLVDAAAGAGFLAALVADASADGGEGVVLLDEGEGVFITALGGQFEIALDADMGGAGGFARRGAGRIAVDAVGVVIAFAPLLAAPFVVEGILHARIDDFAAVFLAKLLPEADGAGGAIFHAAAAGDAVLRIDFGDVGGTGEVRGVEELGGAEGVADLRVAVADGDDLVFAVVIGNLMHVPVLFGFAADF